MVKKILLLFVFISHLTIFAQDGTNDPTFNVADSGYGNGDGANNSINTIVIQPDGKLLIAGNFTKYNGASCPQFARLNVDGTLDEAFATNISGVGISSVRSIILQQDGKIVIAGFISNSALGINHVMRLNLDGTVDSTFVVPYWANDPNGGRALAIQPDGKIIIAFFGEIIRVQTDGSLDTTFNSGSLVNNDTNAISIQPDGKILIGGKFTNYNGISVNRLIRIFSNGSLDNSFNIGTGPSSVFASDNFISKIVVLSDNKIMLSGGFENFNNTYKPYIIKLNEDGSINSDFNPQPVYDTSAMNPDAAINDFLIQSDGKVLICGKFTVIGSGGGYGDNMMRLNSNGTFDNSFSSNAISDNSINKLAFQGTNIVLAGNFDYCKNVTRHKIARISSNGFHDITFNTGSGCNGSIQKITTQTDGKIIVGGTFTLFNGAIRSGIVRLNNDGTLDNTFTNTQGTNGIVNAIKVQLDGKIIIGGVFTAYGSSLRNKIVRVNTNGTLDTSFNIGTGFNDYVSDIIIQPDGKIIVIGAFTSYNGVTANRIVRLNSNGSVDTTFITGTGANNIVSVMALQQDGKILIAGTFTAYNGVSRYRFLRLNSNGSLDTTFFSGTGLNTNAFVSSINIFSDGKILLSGNISSYNNVYTGSMLRLNQDGTINTSVFYSNVNGITGVSEALLINDDYIVFRSSYINILGTSTGFILKLNATNGNIDPNWIWQGNVNSSLVGGGNFFNPSGFPATIALQSDNKILVGGNFISYQNAGRNRIARLNSGVILNHENFNNQNDFGIYNDEFGLHIESTSFRIKEIIIYDINGKLIFEKTDINNSNYCIPNSFESKQIIILKLVGENGKVYTKKYVF